MNLKAIKPTTKGKSDKYSWYLYNFLEKQLKQKDIGKYVPKQLKVYWLNKSRWNGELISIDSNQADMMQIIISPFGGKTGYFLSEILRTGKENQYYLPWSDEDLNDITEWFFSNYEKDGRCIFDRTHSRWLRGDNGQERYTYINNTRRCNWCGQWHTKEIHKEVKIERTEVWV